MIRTIRQSMRDEKFSDAVVASSSLSECHSKKQNEHLFGGLHFNVKFI